MTRIYKQRLCQLYMILLFLAAVLLPCLPASASQKQPESYEIDWEQDVSLKGLFDSTSLYVTTGSRKVVKAELKLQLSFSQLLNREVSYLGISLDGQPVETVSLPGNPGEIAEYNVILPAEAFGGGEGHLITVEAYLRGQTTDACVDDSSISTWLNLFGDSKVTLQYEPLPECKSIADFYERFTSVEALDGGQCMAFIGKGASDTALTAAARILSGIAGNTAGDYEKIRSSVAEDTMDFLQASYVLYVNSYDKLPDKLLREMSDTQREYAESSAVICLLTLQDIKVLLVTGNDDKALANAGFLLSNEKQIRTLKGLQKQVGASADYREPSYEWEEYIPLTEYGAQVKGNFEQSAVFAIDCPTDKRLASSAELSLDYRYSANLDFAKSLVTVYVNDVPVGSRALTEEGADGTTEVFQIPEDINAVGNFSVETRFALYPKGEWCEETPETIPWAYVADTSMLKWTTTDQTEVFFEYYPFPFIKNGEFSGLKVLLPARWENEDFTVMAQIMLTMGSWLKSNAGELKVLTSPQAEALVGSHLIAIGSPGRNHLDTGELRINSGQGCAALMLEGDSDILHARLIITGERRGDMEKLLSYFGSRDKLWKIKGDLLYTDGEDVSYSYIRTKKKKAEQPEIPKPALAEQNIPVIAVCAVFILILLSAAMLLIKYGRKKNER